MASKSVNCKVPLVPTMLVKTGGQLVTATFKLVVVRIRQVVLVAAWKLNSKLWLLDNRLESIKTGGAGGNDDRKAVRGRDGGAILAAGAESGGDGH